MEIAIIEVGLGGRLDATNVLTPLLTVCTDISFDHVDILGDTLTKIATEKAGIIKPGVPHLIGLLPGDAERVMRQTCKARQAPLHRLSRRQFKTYPEQFALDFSSGNLSVKRLSPALIGRHQLVNTALALKTLSLCKSLGLRVPDRAVCTGLKSTDWPGRFQIINVKQGPTLLLDVCHNQGGARAFTESFRLKYPGRKVPLIVGVVKKKQHQEMFDALAPIAASYTLVRMKTKRSVEPSEVIATTHWHGVPVTGAASLGAAYRKLLKSLGPDDILPVIGSHYLVGEFLESYVWK